MIFIIFSEVYCIVLYFIKIKLQLNCNLGCSEQNLASNLTLVKEIEIEDILSGNEDKYKAVVVSSEPSFNKV